MLKDILKTKGQKSMMAILLAVVIFVSIATGFGGHSSPASGADNQVLQQAAANYFERLPDNMNKIKEAELKQLVDNNDQSIYLIDIRDAKDFSAGHIQGAHNIPFREVGRNMNSLPKDKTLIVYCHTGQTAGQTVAALNIAGFKARSLNGGMNNGWKAQQYPTVTD
ncbi:MAG: rhodanese-like domain-containing protein [Bacillota bacterium]